MRGMATQQQVPAPPEPSATPLSWVYIIGGCVFPFLDVLPQLRQLDIGGGLGRMFGLIFFPFLIAYLVKGRKRDLKGFSRWFFWLCLIVGVGGLRYTHQP